MPHRTVGWSGLGRDTPRDEAETTLAINFHRSVTCETTEHLALLDGGLEQSALLCRNT